VYSLGSAAEKGRGGEGRRGEGRDYWVAQFLFGPQLKILDREGRGGEPRHK
jgi:hypothetical protein